jgi:hypothetical protein
MTIQISYTQHPVISKQKICFKREEVSQGWGKFHTEELHDFYSAPSRIRVLKLRTG